jgi:hypothetical protein
MARHDVMMHNRDPGFGGFCVVIGRGYWCGVGSAVWCQTPTGKRLAREVDVVSGALMASRYASEDQKIDTFRAAG